MEKRRYLPIRWFLLVYTPLAILGTALYIAFNHVYYKIDWNRYNSDGNYYIWVEKVKKLGLFQITDNVTALHSWFLIGLLLFGVALSLFVFLYGRWTYLGRSWMPLISLFAYLFAFLPLGTENILYLLIMSYLLSLFGAVFSALSIRKI